MQRRGSSRSGGAPSQFSSTFIAQLLPTGVLQHHIRHVLQPAYAERYHRTMSAIREHLLPLGATLPSKPQEIAGGCFIWIGLPSPLCASDIARRALQDESLRVASGELFRVKGDPAPERSHIEDSVRICYAWEDADKLDEGIRRLARTVRRAKESAHG